MKEEEFIDGNTYLKNKYIFILVICYEKRTVFIIFMICTMKNMKKFDLIG